MRLVFRGRKHADVSLHPGELNFGASPECDVHCTDAGWFPHEATLSVHPQRGLWLHLMPGTGIAHVNARPVRELAMLRLGDIVSLGDEQFCVMLESGDVLVRDLPSTPNTPAGEAERVAAARAVLRGVAGVYHGMTFPLREGVVIGSGADADVRIEGAGLAPHHSRLNLRHEQVVLRAEAPGQALQVNGETVENAVLHPGDQIVIEPHRFVIEAPGLPPRGTTEFVARQRPITQIMQAVPSTPPQSRPQPAPAQATARPASGRAMLGWLLLAATGIAVALAILLWYAPR